MKRRPQVPAPPTAPILERAAPDLLGRQAEAALLDLAQWSAGISVDANIDKVRRTHTGWDLEVTVTFMDADQPLLVEAGRDGGWRLAADDLPSPLADVDPDVSADVAAFEVAATVLQRDTGLTWALPTQWSPFMHPDDDGRSPLMLRGSVKLRPGAVRELVSLSEGCWDVQARVNAFGRQHVEHLRVAQHVPRTQWRPLANSRGKPVVTPIVAPPAQRLSLQVGAAPRGQRLIELRRRWAARDHSAQA